MSKLLELVRSKLGCGYVWGAQGEILTPEKLSWFKRTFGATHYDFMEGNTPVSASKWLGKQVFDCSGLIVWALQELGLIGKGQDYNDTMLYNQLCTPISKADLQPGDLVFSSGHVGVYAGNGKTVEAMSTRMGVVEGNVNRFNKFGRLKFNLAAAPATAPASMAGNAHVLSIQKLCNALACRDDSGSALAEDGIMGPRTRQAIAKLPVISQGSGITPAVKYIQSRVGALMDGAFGPKTKEAVVKFQRKNGLVPDGVVGPMTWAKLGGV